MPDSPTSTNSSSSLMAPARAIRMPCKILFKRPKLKRRSLPNPGASISGHPNSASLVEATSSSGRWRMARQQRNSIFRSLFPRNSNLTKLSLQQQDTLVGPLIQVGSGTQSIIMKEIDGQKPIAYSSLPTSDRSQEFSNSTGHTSAVSAPPFNQRGGGGCLERIVYRKIHEKEQTIGAESRKESNMRRILSQDSDQKDHEGNRKMTDPNPPKNSGQSANQLSFRIVYGSKNETEL